MNTRAAEIGNRCRSSTLRSRRFRATAPRARCGSRPASGCLRTTRPAPIGSSPRRSSRSEGRRRARRTAAALPTAPRGTGGATPRTDFGIFPVHRHCSFGDDYVAILARRGRPILPRMRTKRENSKRPASFGGLFRVFSARSRRSGGGFGVVRRLSVSPLRGSAGW